MSQRFKTYHEDTTTLIFILQNFVLRDIFSDVLVLNGQGGGRHGFHSQRAGTIAAVSRRCDNGKGSIAPRLLAIMDLIPDYPSFATIDAILQNSRVGGRDERRMWVCRV